MKYLYLVILISVICLDAVFTQSTPSNTTVSRNVLATLQPEEGILQDESCFPLDLNGSQFYMVTMLDGKYFIYENGQHKGPFADLEKAGYKPCADNSPESSCSAYKPEQSQPDPGILTLSDDGQSSIKFKDKTYGPYTLFADIQVSPDNAEFVAIAMNADMTSYLITSGGQKILLEGQAEAIHVSPSGKNYVVVVKENPNQNAAILSMDFSKMSTEEIMKFAKEQEEKAKQAGPPKAWVYTKTGPKIGPFDAQQFYSGNVTFTQSGGDNWIMIMDNSLYINGVMKKKFEDLDLNSCSIWVSKDGKRFAAASYDKVVFSDGSVYAFPIKIIVVDNAGKSMMKWVSLENDKDLVFYSREL